MSTLTQKALLLTSKNGEWKIGEVTVPTPGPKDVLVKVMAAALNPVDWKNREHEYFTPAYPFIAGMDGAGVVESIGTEVSTLAAGDRVLFQGNFDNDHGTFQQYCIVPAGIAGKIPENISFEQAASVPLGLGTALAGQWNHNPDAHTLNFPAPWEDSGKTQFANKPVFVIGGSSSVGQYAIQMAALSGFSPIITTASPHNASALTALGATHVLDRTLAADALLREVRARTSGAPLEFVFDAILLPETQALGYDALAPGGALLLVLPNEIPAEKNRAGGGKRVVSAYGVVHNAENRAVGVQVFSRVEEWLRTGVLVPNKVEVLPGGLSGIPEGLARMKANQVSDVKLVVRPQDMA